MRLMRLMKLQKTGNFSLITWFQAAFNVSPDCKWFLTFACYYAMMAHVVTCIWIIVAKLDPDPEGTWLTGNNYIEFIDSETGPKA